MDGTAARGAFPREPALQQRLAAFERRLGERFGSSQSRLARSAELMAASTEQIARSSDAVHRSRALLKR